MVHGFDVMNDHMNALNEAVIIYSMTLCNMLKAVQQIATLLSYPSVKSHSRLNK